MAEQPHAVPATRCLLALLYADLERSDEARREYERLASDDFAGLRRRNALHPLALCLSEVAVFLGDHRRAAMLYDDLFPFSGRVMGLGPSVLFGPAAHGLARLAAFTGAWERAEAHFEEALTQSRRMQAPAWRAAIEYDYARELLEHGQRTRAAELAAAAAQRAHELGMVAVATATRALRDRIVVSRAAVGTHAPGSLSALPPRTSGRRVLPFPTAAERAPSAANAAVFRCEGEYWTIGYRGELMRLRSTSGLHYLAELLRNGGREFHALDLAVAGRGPAPPGEAPASTHGGGERDGNAVELLDVQARAEYKRRLADLRDQLDEAQRFNDLERAARLQAEIDFIARELARALGLRGRVRPGASQAERARLNVTRAIKSALRRIARTHRDLGLYLNTTIKTGLYCSYTPDPRLEVQWTF